MSKPVREPLQVYLSSGERETLDNLADDLEVSRSEVLRRGLLALGAASRVDPVDLFLGALGADAPSDLAQRHDEYLADTIENKWSDPPPTSS